MFRDQLRCGPDTIGKIQPSRMVGPAGPSGSADLACLTSEAASLKATSLKAPILRTRKLILVVEDDPSMLKVIERMLKMHGFDAELFNSVEDFEKRANFRDATCLVLDVNLKGKSGIDLRRRIAMSGISIPAVFITGNDNPTVRKAASDADCSAFLVKPFPAKSLMDAIARATPEPARSK